jgi:alpha-beta hydrolase superfamily lysophospholipase
MVGERRVLTGRGFVATSLLLSMVCSIALPSAANESVKNDLQSERSGSSEAATKIVCLRKKKKDGQQISEKKGDKSSDEKVAKAPRETTGTRVDLVDGMPPFLFWQSTADSPKGMVLCLHELGMHNGVFEDLAKKLQGSGYSVYSMDLRGFGGWSDKGPAGQMNLKNTLADIKSAAEAIKKKHPGTKVFLLGEAMGGALALEAASKYSDIISGAISSAPGGEHFGTLGNYLSVGTRFTAGNKRFNKGEDLVKIATPKKDLQEALIKDANVRLNLAPKELMACQFYMYRTRQFAKQIKSLPIMIVQGQKDGESRPEGAKKVFDNLATEDKEYLALDNGDHYVYEDINVDDKAMKSTVAWLDKHSAN